jgi:transcriptional regulator GlxA family with amidase domain
MFLLTETGLFDGQETTVYWGYAKEFARVFPSVPPVKRECFHTAKNHSRLPLF